MADLPTNIRLAVDSGKVALGLNKVVDSIREDTAKLVIVASGNRSDIIDDINHVTKVSGTKLVVFDGNSMELGAVCGKPYSVAVLSVIEEGNSKILEEV
ncbi:MAG: 50S ribosomal protein L30e [Candidatus Marsarchaeota archaeon]|nr:50S ribosomal protein L30e [Candidatus Marsarchaeota archaeon]